MTLAEYCQWKKITSKAFAKTLGVSEDAVKKWRVRKGSNEYRIPRPSTMLKIQRVTKGNVSYSDWF